VSCLQIRLAVDLNLSMTRHRAWAMRLRIVIDAVTAAFAYEHATMSF